MAPKMTPFEGPKSSKSLISIAFLSIWAPPKGSILGSLLGPWPRQPAAEKEHAATAGQALAAKKHAAAGPQPGLRKEHAATFLAGRGARMSPHVIFFAEKNMRPWMQEIWICEKSCRHDFWIWVRSPAKHQALVDQGLVQILLGPAGPVLRCQ